MTTDKPQRRDIDWEAVEVHYRAGIRSLKDIGKEYGVSDAGIHKRAKRDAWVRDLKARIQQRAEAKVNAAAVRAEVNATRTANEKEVVEANAEVQTRIRLAHRTDIASVRKLCMSLFAELEAQSQPERREALENLGDLLRAPDQRGMDKLNEVYRAVISLPERTKTLKALAESLKMLIALEREAFGIVSAEGDGPKGVDAAEVVRLLAAQLPD